ncbi:hypothetical protein ACFL2D_00120 [Patescibacteria group bacterium]
MSNMKELAKMAEDRATVKLVNMMLRDAVSRKARSILLNSRPDAFGVYYTSDEYPETEVMRPPIRMRQAMFARLKIMAHMPLTETSDEQTGKLELKMSADKTEKFDLTVRETKGNGVMILTRNYAKKKVGRKALAPVIGRAYFNEQLSHDPIMEEIHVARGVCAEHVHSFFEIIQRSDDSEMWKLLHVVPCDGSCEKFVEIPAAVMKKIRAEKRELKKAIKASTKEG